MLNYNYGENMLMQCLVQYSLWIGSLRHVTESGFCVIL